MSATGEQQEHERAARENPGEHPRVAGAVPPTAAEAAPGPLSVDDHSAGTARPERSALRWLVLSAAIIGVDQLTKALIVARFEQFERIYALPILEITRLHNPGAAFSFLAGASGWQRWFFVTLAAVVSVGIVWWLSRLRFRADRLLAIGLACILGGALGNVIDRLAHGHVIDFLHFHWRQGWYFPAFNVADTFITIGAALLILDSLLESRRAPRPAAGG